MFNEAWHTKLLCGAQMRQRRLWVHPWPWLHCHFTATRSRGLHGPGLIRTVSSDTVRPVGRARIALRPDMDPIARHGPGPGPDPVLSLQRRITWYNQGLLLKKRFAFALRKIKATSTIFPNAALNSTGEVLKPRPNLYRT